MNKRSDFRGLLRYREFLRFIERWRALAPPAGLPPTKDPYSRIIKEFNDESERCAPSRPAEHRNRDPSGENPSDHDSNNHHPPEPVALRLAGFGAGADWPLGSHLPDRTFAARLA